MNRLILICFLLIPLNLLSKNTVINVKAPSYKGKELIFYAYTEKILYRKKEVFRIHPDENSYFRTEIKLNTVTYLFSEHEGCKFFFYAEPGNTYHLTFPEPCIKSPEDKTNPFFKPAPVHLNVQSESIIDTGSCIELNEAIRLYDKAFDPFYNSQLLRYYTIESNREKLDSFNIQPQLPGSPCNDEYFSQYVKYKTGILEFTVDQPGINQLIINYFTSSPVLTHVPSWWELFNMVFDKYFTLLNNSRNFKDLFETIASSDYQALNILLKKDPGLKNDTIRELVLIKELHNIFPEGYISHSVLSALLDSISLQSTSSLCRELSEAVKLKNIKLLPGAPAPSFILRDLSGVTYSSGDFKDKYLYIGFCNPNSLSCIKEFEYLQYLHQKHNKHLAIVTVFDELSFEELKIFKEINNYRWLLTKSVVPYQFQQDYNIKVGPQFFLIGPDGNIALSPAPLPSENFEKVLFSVMRKRGDI